LLEHWVEVFKRRNLKLRNLAQSHEIELALTTYQFVIASSFILDNAYIKPADIREFGAIIWNQALKDRYLDATRYVERYMDTNIDETGRMMRLCRDVAREMSEDATPIDAGLMGIFLPLLIIGTHLSVARTFGDRWMIRKLKKQLRNVV